MRVDRGRKVEDVSGSDPKPQRFYAEDLQEVSFIQDDGSTLTLKATGGAIETSDPWAVPRLQELADTDGHPLTDKAPQRTPDKRERE